MDRVFVQAVKYLEANTKCEGLFRKAGSVARQKSLRVGCGVRVCVRVWCVCVCVLMCRLSH